MDIAIIVIWSVVTGALFSANCDSPFLRNDKDCKIIKQERVDRMQKLFQEKKK